jgi:hypothetical protein
MGYIGTKPSAVPLTSADITDGIIVNADISSTAGITLNKISGNPSFRNIVINGDMQVAQRNTSVASITTTGYYTLDRWYVFFSSLGTWTQSQSTDVPSGYGFSRSFKMDCTTADASPSASDRLLFRQAFEGQNVQYLKKGTANAVSLTASFWVKSTKTGTFIIELGDGDNGRSISKSYTVNVSNTWEFKTVTFAGDTTGALDNDNAESLALNFWLGAGTDFTSGTLATSWGTSVSANRAVGQVNIADSTSNDWLITGIQLEAGTSATDFEFLPIDVDLERCQRYYYLHAKDATQTIGTMWWYLSGTNSTNVFFKTSMRAAPSLVSTTGTNFYRVFNGGAATDFNSVGAITNASTNAAAIDTSLSGASNYVGRFVTNAGGLIAFDSEL